MRRPLSSLRNGDGTHLRLGSPAPRLEPLWQRFEGLGVGRGAAAVFFVFLFVYLVTATYGTLQSVDTAAAAIPAHQLAEHGTLRVDPYAHMTPWFRPGRDGGQYSNRFPGTIFAAVPFYGVARLLGATGESLSFAPAGVAAATFAAATVALLFVVFRRLVDARVALTGAVVAGLGTSTWSVSADALWSHSPAQLLLVGSLLAWPAKRYALGGTAFAMAILTRPQLAVVPFVVGLAEGWRRRSLRPVLVIGVLSAVALAALLLYNRWLFADASVDAQRPYVEEHLARLTVAEYGSRWLLSLFSPSRGLFVYSPFLAVLLLGARTAWSEAPAWVRTAAVSGVAYLAVQLAVNVYHGGDYFFSYRLPLESVTLLAPLFLLAYDRWGRCERSRRHVLLATVAWAVLLQLFGATYYIRLLEKVSS